MDSPSTNKNVVRFLVLSDLHVEVDEPNSKDSRLIFANGESEFGEGFIEYAKSVVGQVDALLCPGDITNKADTNSFEQGWRFLNQLKDELSIQHILCVPGNHDHQSRKTEGVFDPKHHLQFVSPSFPFKCESKNTHFWAWNWCHSLLPEAEYNVVSLNTSAYHGYSDEWSHGRVATEITDQISSFIKSDEFPLKKFNVLICHHHPEKMDFVDQDYDGQAMEGGSYLIRKICDANQGPWLIIHGHKHFADITYSKSSGITAPTIFSAGSFSARLYPKIEKRTSNQFYVIEIDIEKTEDEDKLVGNFEAHEWTVSNGWSPSTAEQLPAKGGFGNLYSPKKIAKEIVELIDEQTPFLDKSDLEQFEEKLKHFTPLDLRQLINHIEQKGFEVNFEANEIVEIGLPHDQQNS